MENEEEKGVNEGISEDEERRRLWLVLGNEDLPDSELVDQTADIPYSEVEHACQSKEILDIERLVKVKFGMFKRNIWEIGKLLHYAKKHILSHGTFQAWIKDRFSDDFSYPTAHNFMRIYLKFQARPEIVKAVPMKYLLLAIGKYGDKAEEELVKLVNDDFDKGAVKEVKEKLIASTLTGEEMRAKGWEKVEKKEGKWVNERWRPLDEVDKKMMKYEEGSQVKHFEWLFRSVIPFTRYARQIQLRFKPLSESLDELVNSEVYLPEKVLDILQRTEDLGLMKEIEKARSRLDETEQAFIKAKNHFQGKVKMDSKI
jgi:hypothetical protein